MNDIIISPTLAVGAVVGIMLFCTLLIFGIQLLILRLVTPMQEINSRIFAMGHLLQSMSTNLQLGQVEEAMNEMMRQQQEALMKDKPHGKGFVIRSGDGKIEAESIEEFIQKVTSDPSSGLSEQDSAVLRKAFEEIIRRIEAENREDEDDEEDSGENWKKPKDKK